ncbi:hypothetical protein ACT7V1_001218 [Salmonella enterica subsp. enterica]
MKIRVEVSQSELDEMMCDSVGDFCRLLRKQLDEAIVDENGGSGADWMADYELVVANVS